MKKTILYIGAFKLPAGNAAAQRVRSNAKIFRDLGYRVILVGFDAIKGDSRTLVRRGSFAADGFHQLVININGSHRTRLLRRISPVIPSRLMRMRFGKPTVICYNYLTIPQAIIQASCRRRGLSFLPDVTEWYGADGNAPFRDGIKWIDTTLRMRVLNRLANAFVVTSPFIERFYQKSGKPILLLPTLFDRQAIGIDTFEGTDFSTLRVIYAGSPFNVNARRPEPSKMKERLDIVIALVASANAAGALYHLDVFGVTAAQYLRAFPQSADQLREAAPWLTFRGSVAQKEVLVAMKNAHFSIFLREEHRVNLAGFPSKFAESISCGTPVITNIMENISDYAVEGRNCIEVELDDIETGRNKLMAIWNDRARIVAQTKAYCRASDVFDYRSWIDRSRNFASTVFG
jgi:glycosyltransferase involved in cell wall biosynthesis